MTTQELQEFLMWCSILNSGLLMSWFLIITMAGGWVHRIHGRWFNLSRERFDAIHYQQIGNFKVVIMVFNVTPYVALLLIS